MTNNNHNNNTYTVFYLGFTDFGGDRITPEFRQVLSPAGGIVLTCVHLCAHWGVTLRCAIQRAGEDCKRATCRDRKTNPNPKVQWSN